MPSRSMRFCIRSPPKMRSRSSCRERKKRDAPGSPWRPARPRNWLSMRRESCRSVPTMNRPPSFTTSSCSASVAYKQETDAEHDEVVKLGGLFIVGTERHDSRRIDNQLRGRAGRQGDPGASRFFLSLQDDLLRIFGGERMQNLMLRLGMEEDVPIESRLITKRIQKAQEAVEAQNFEARKHLLEYDDVNNKQ